MRSDWQLGRHIVGDAARIGGRSAGRTAQNAYRHEMCWKGGTWPPSYPANPAHVWYWWKWRLNRIESCERITET